MNVNEKIYTRLTGIVLLLFLLAGFLTLDDYGKGWDEVVRWKSGDLKLAYYQNLFSGESHDIERHMAGDRYPGLFDLPLALFHATFGGNRMIQGHVLSICFGALGLAATAWLGSTVFNRRTGFFAALLLAILPLFYGHAMINPKDIPFLATYTLGLAALTSLARGIAVNEKLRLRHFLYCGLAIGAAGASRVPGLVLLGFAATIWPAAWLLPCWFNRQAIEAGRKGSFLAGGLVLTVFAAFMTVLLFFPRAQLQLFSGLPDVATELHTSAAKLPLIYGGMLMDAADGPVTYAHGFFILSTPLWMLLLLVAGFGFLIQHMVRGPQGQVENFILRLFFISAAAFPWTYILVTHPALHDGMRHMLFAIPPLVIVMAVGLDGIFSRAGTGSVAAKRGCVIALAACVLIQIAALRRMHPYQYVSFNALAGERATIPDRYETEYWCTSSRHLLEAMPEVAGFNGSTGRAVDVVRIRFSGALDSARPFVPEGFSLVDTFEEADYYIANAYLRSDLYAEGEVVYRIERGGIPIGVIKKLPPQGHD